MSENPCTIYVFLLGAGTDVWRPVQAEHVGSDCYRIVSENPDPADEVWQFPSDAIVRCRERKLSGGNRVVAYELVEGLALERDAADPSSPCSQ